MIKTLLNKQMSEIFKGYFYNAKKNEKRSKLSTTLFFIIYALVMIGVLGGIFGALAYLLCEPLASVGFGWFYYAIMSLIAIALGTFGSVFNTFSGLYLSKDNDLLLSMPIPVKSILISRLLGVYLLGLMYSAVVTVPTAVIYWIKGSVTVTSVIGGICMVLIVSVINLVLSCILGWGVARLSLKLKNKSFVTVFLALAFIALYYFVYFKAQQVITDIIENVAIYGNNVKENAKGMYYFGAAGAGEMVPLLVIIAIVAAITAITYVILEKSFIKIATSTGVTTKAKYVEKKVKSKGIFHAVLLKEFGRFTSSPNYMLNCALGTVFLPIFGVFMFIKGEDMMNLVLEITGSKDALFLIFATAVLIMMAMNDSATPSVSLEGKAMWLTQSLPIPSKMFLNAKMLVQILVAGVPALFTTTCIAIVWKGTVTETLLFFAAAIVGILFFATFDMVLGIHFVNLTWTSEIIPIKQSFGVLIALFGGWAVGAVWPLIYFLAKVKLAVELFVLIEVLVLAIATVGLYIYIMKAGTKKFEEL